MSQIALILDNIRSTHNVGSILRSANGFGVSHVYFAGYTPYPSTANDTRLPHESKKITAAISKTALGAEKSVVFSTYATCNDAIIAAKNDGFTIAALEQSDKSILLSDYYTEDNMAVILGNEVTGISHDIIMQAAVVLEIPMQGSKESFNVSVSAAICLYALRNQCK